MLHLWNAWGVGHGGHALPLLAAAAVVVAIASPAVEPAHAYSYTHLHLEPLPLTATAGDAVELYGWLSDSDGYAVEGASIEIKDDVDFGFDDTLGYLTTGEDGTFRGAWTASERGGGGAWDIYAAFEGTASLSESRSRTYSVVVVDAPAPTAPAKRGTNLHLEPLPSTATAGDAVELYGWLSDSDGYAVKGASIEIKDDVDFGFDDTLGYLTTGEDGTFRGAWTASERGGGGAWDIYAAFEGTASLSESRSRTYSVAVAGPPDSTRPTQLSLGPVPGYVQEGQTVTFEGALLSGGRPVAGALIEIKDDDLLRPDDLLAHGRTGPDGRFSIPWAAEQGLVETELDVYAEYDGDALHGPSTTSRRAIVVAPAPTYPTSLELDALPRAAYVGDTVAFTGRLLHANLPLEGAVVKIKEDDPLKPDQLLGSGWTGPDGGFAVRWTASPGLVETDFDVYAEFGGAGGYEKSQTARQEMAVLKYGGDIRFDPFPRSVAEGDVVMFTGTLALDGHETEGAKVYIMDEDMLNPDDLLAAAYVGADGRFAANWFASRVDADRTADVYAVFEGSDRFYRQTTCDEGPTFDFGGMCTGTVEIAVSEGRGGDPGGAYGRWGDGTAYMEMHYSQAMPGRPHVAIVPSPDGPGDARRYIVPVQEGILTWTSAMEGRYGGDWGVTFSVVEPGDPFFDGRPDVIVNLISHEGDAGCLDEYSGRSELHSDPPKTVQTVVCTTSGGSPVSRSDASETAAHEFIHAVGLGHTFNKAGDLMCSAEDGRATCPGPGPESGVPSDLNAAAVAQMYGTDGFAVPNNPVEYKSRFYEGAPDGAAPASLGPAGAASPRPYAASSQPGPGAGQAVVPAWIKASAGWWADGLVSDEAFVRGIEYMIQNGIVQVRQADGAEGGADGGPPAIPQWVKAGAKRWADGLVSDEAFARGIGLLVSMGIIRV